MSDRNTHGEALRELEVVALRARPVAERGEVEPDGAARAAARRIVRPSIASRAVSSGPVRIASNARSIAASACGPAGTWNVCTCSSARSR